MASSSRRARVAICVVLALAIGLMAYSWEPLYWFATTRVEYFEVTEQLAQNYPVVATIRGYKRIVRWSDEEFRDQHGEMRAWYVNTGFLAIEASFVWGETIGCTVYSIDGRIVQQRQYSPYDDWFEEPPWKWGKVSHASPSIPAWVADDEQWAAREPVDEY